VNSEVVAILIIISISCPEGTSDSEQKQEGKAKGDTTTPEYPGNNPKKSPGKDWEWRGKGEPGSGEGNWYNPKTGESLHPDLDHPDPIGSHWDYKDPDGIWYRLNPDGTLTPK